MKTTTLICITLAGLMLTGCQRPGTQFDARSSTTLTNMEPVAATNRVDSNWLKPSTDPFILGPGDRLEIELADDLTSKSFVTVGPDGKIYFSLLPGVDVWGLSLGQARDRLESELAKFVKEPQQVMITLREVGSKRVWLLGRLQSPGVYPMATPVTLLEAIAHAGGPANIGSTKDFTVAENSSELADLRRSFVIRKGEVLPIDFHRLVLGGDMSQNIYLQPDDFVYFPPATASEVYVMGGVSYPRAVAYTEDLTLTAAIANCYGTVKDAYLTHVAVVRGSLSEPRIAIIDYNRIVRGQATDIQLEPKDIVYVPLTPYKLLSRYADIIMNTFVSSIAINEGSRAVIKAGGSGPAGVVIPIGSRIQVIPPPAGPPR